MDTALAHVFVNFSKRKLTIVDEEGYEKEVNWKWDMEGAEGFSETIAELHDILDEDMITYCFGVQ